MPLSIRQQIIAALLTQLQTITVANGYTTALGTNVSESLTRKLDPSELPAAIVREGERSVEAEYPAHRHDLSVFIDLIANGEPSVMRQTIADVEKALGVDTTLGGLAINLQLTGDEADYDQADQKFGLTTMSISINYRTKEWNPYET